MKKYKLFLPVILILLIIASISIYSYIINLKTSAFPHYKQVALKYNGNMTVFTDHPFALPIYIVDTFDLSEIASNTTIKFIKIVEKNGKEHLVDNWNIGESIKKRNFIRRTLILNPILKNEGIHTINTLKIVFEDNVEEVFDIGEINIDALSDYALNHKYLTTNTSSMTLNSKSDDRCPFSTVFVDVRFPHSGDYIIKSIDLGIDNLYIDPKDIKILNIDATNAINDILSLRYEDSEYPYKDRANNTEAYKHSFYDKAKFEPTRTSQESFKDLEIEVKNMNDIITLVLPVIYNDKTDFDKILLLNPQINIDYKGKTYNIKGLNPELKFPKYYKSLDFYKLVGENDNGF